MCGAVTPRHLYVTMMCTGTAVTSYSCCNVICKITGSNLQLYWTTIPTHCIYISSGDRSECNGWIVVPGL